MDYDLVSLVPLMCEGFIGSIRFEAGSIAQLNRLDRSRLDYSIASLSVLDRWLPHVAAAIDTTEEQTITNTILGAGCYVGETIRRNSELDWTWYNYDAYFASHQDLTDIFPKMIGTAAVMASTAGKRRMTLPINKVVRFIYEGPENNISFYASGELHARTDGRTS